MLYSSYLQDELWLIKEMEWVASLQNIRESQFALGNGYFSSRAVLEEIPYDAMPGLYLAGIYDKMGSQVKELVNFPNPFNFKFTVEGEKIGLVAMKNISHRRVLNLKKALLIRHTIFENVKKERFDYQSIRFISYFHKNLAAMQIVFTPLDNDCVVDIYTGIDTAVFNAGAVTEGRKKHFKIKEAGQFKNAGFLILSTLEKKYIVIYWSGFYYEIGKRKKIASDNVFQLKIKKGESVKFTKIIFIKHFPYRENISRYKNLTFKKFFYLFHTPFENLISSHIKRWEKLWKRMDIKIEGTANLQQNLRFNLYHLLICAPQDEGFSSVGARTLSGEGYHGHIFWDAEIFVLPFYLYNFPEIAKNLLLYRAKRINMAKRLAKEEGFEGAKFPWESADTGEEETPSWAPDFDGSIIKIYTHKQEHHINADIAYAFYNYYFVTQDEDFMQKYGYEAIFELARFWSRRVQFNRKKRRYEINNVIGPDEFHINVNNNAYTNGLVRWNLDIAYQLYFELKRRKKELCKKLKEKLNLTDKEVKEWKKISSLIYFPFDKKTKLIEQFEGYFKLKDIKIVRTDENGMPLLPSSIKPKDLKYTKLVKQADVLMLLYLLEDKFPLSVIKSNYEFYISRTLHKSSLSAPIHSLIAAKCADLHRAYVLFNVSLRTDISNLYGNTAAGMHAASLGGTWQALIFGFCGVRFRDNTIFVNPNLPYTWRRVKFSLTYRKSLINFELTNDCVKIKISYKGKKKFKVIVFGEKKEEIKAGRFYKFFKEYRERKEDYY
ncbi:MAG: hypothetical protein B6D56_00055 [Candidatus Omnitrophica bacterium 4484_70.1]|nr:MAG: hypothetical protein B6D56_00055 [Candidatus Omnitrophica bacterium 4484_70.1]